MKIVAVEIEEEQSSKDANTLRKREMEQEEEDTTTKKVKIESESDSEDDEFFDAHSSFANVDIEAIEHEEPETRIGPIDTGYKKVYKRKMWNHGDFKFISVG
jgi:hypothetical protein